MRPQRPDENPFDLIKASDFSDNEILAYWVDIAGEHGGLLSVLKPRMTMPMLLLGGKGSGKTHLMRYCSAPVQAARAEGNLSKAVSNDGYIGIYVRAEGLNVGKFNDKGQSETAWSAIFCMYLEIWLATSLLNNLRVLLDSNSAITLDEAAFAADVGDLFDEDVGREFSNLEELRQYLVKVRKSIDLSVNNAALTRRLEGININFSMGRLVFGIPQAIAARVVDLKDTIFVYLIDEAENFTESQQKFLNSLIRYRSGNATIKVGARLYGIKTYDTIGAGEPIKQSAEYEKVELDSFLRDHDVDYERFVCSLIVKRLQRVGVVAKDFKPENLHEFFQELDKKNYYEAPALEAVGSWDKRGDDRPYIKRLKKHLNIAFGLSLEQSNNLIKPLRFVENPYLEKANVFRFYRQWPRKSVDVDNTAVRIGQELEIFLRGGKDASPKYAQMLSHFDSDILAQLFRDCQRKVPYAGLKPLIHLSQGVPRNLLGILKHIYRRALFAGEAPFVYDPISVTAQSEGVMDSASWFWDDAQPDSYGTEVRDGIEALAVLFRTIRYSERPSECDLCTFSVDIESLSEGSRLVLRMAQSWSYLIAIRSGASNRNDDSLDAKFQLGPMLAPKWGLSPHRRGSIEIKPELANALFDRSERKHLAGLFKRRIAEMTAPSFFAQRSDTQDVLL
ncbi:hypothetical protein [Methylorubrum sp. GM97]|uniref:ORC-CDC6 family AAA ATPase n=1 Tax=Methylorubrum sp. GM97 TaxID=2938232 RepID=UPI002189A442|nr:hypothetical protein [Methylorubrum sp. GM97]BDL37554.1 hypothetical protein MSPGM_01440 [Methylorubrum sp. GM97]